ncbi:hypothetical protein [Pyxidicoccus parkwayensis]|uniref:hypothetical protein n=1 Tax=Pyxidicoccus parkwayensis TaxID=2813578 RepID=UPI001F51564F|nr:hypothetical protein [Pyxidicoccus parkwaysis]
MVAWDAAPMEPWESIECVRYSPMASITLRMGPSPRSNTTAPFGAFQPAEV